MSRAFTFMSTELSEKIVPNQLYDLGILPVSVVYSKEIHKI